MIHPELYEVTKGLFDIITQQRPTNEQLLGDRRIQDAVQSVVSFYDNEFNRLFPGEPKRAGQATINGKNEKFMISFSSSDERWADYRLMTGRWVDGMRLSLEASCEGGHHHIERIVIENEDKLQVWLGFPYAPIPPVSLSN